MRVAVGSAVSFTSSTVTQNPTKVALLASQCFGSVATVSTLIYVTNVTQGIVFTQYIKYCVKTILNEKNSSFRQGSSRNIESEVN